MDADIDGVHSGVWVGAVSALALDLDDQVVAGSRDYSGPIAPKAHRNHGDHMGPHGRVHVGIFQDAGLHHGFGPGQYLLPGLEHEFDGPVQLLFPLLQHLGRAQQHGGCAYRGRRCGRSSAGRRRAGRSSPPWAGHPYRPGAETPFPVDFRSRWRLRRRRRCSVPRRPSPAR